MKNVKTRFPWAHLAAAALSGILLAFAHSLRPLALLAWLGAVPVLVATGRSRPLAALLYGGLTGFLASISLLPYLIKLSGLPAALSLSLLRAVVWGIALFAASFAGKRLQKPLSVFVFPALMAGLDLMTNLLSPHGSGGSFAYSQMEVPQILGLARLGGTPLMVFVVLLFSSLVSHLLLYGKKAIPVAGLSLLLMTGLILLSQARGQTAPQKTLQLGLFASDRHQGVTMSWRGVWQDYRLAIQDRAGQDELIILPEKLFQISEADTKELLDEVKQTAKRQGAVMVLGLDERVGEKAFNRAYLVTPEGDTYQYDKQHMIPGAEDHFELGKGPLQVPYQGLLLGLAICKDLDFPHTIRAYAGSDLMLVPAWDFYEDDWFHSRMAILRGVENGFPLARSARRGFLTVSDQTGNVLAQTESRTFNVAYLSLAVSLGHQQTIYSRIGDAFGWLALSYALIVLLVAIKKGNAGQTA